MRMLVSVRTPDEALAAARGGADFIDLKEPRQGALGGLPLADIRIILARLREAGSNRPVSATIGDLVGNDLGAALVAARGVGDCGVDYVKVGIERAPGAFALLDALAHCGCNVIPVFIVDRGLDLGLVAHAATLGFPGLMADTADKRAGSLFDRVSPGELRRFLAIARGPGAPERMAGLAGALRLEHLPALTQLAPDFAGFRSAVCRGDRGQPLDEALVLGLALQLGNRQAARA